MKVVYTPVPRDVPFARGSRRGSPVHRVRRIQHVSWRDTGKTWYEATWECGGSSIRALIVENPEQFGGVCGRCEALLTSAIVYRCYSADGQLLYIGSCINWDARVGLHEKDSPWWPEVARVDKVPQPDINEARRVETAAIKAEAPLHNKVHNVKRFRRDGYGFAPVAGAA